ncbi:hypothetical protein VB735_03920 [Halotia wernerae UHCC 0503]|nr:hypothetical protein [Halotia wernerae UHCC 0503]
MLLTPLSHLKLATQSGDKQLLARRWGIKTKLFPTCDRLPLLATVGNDFTS